jgi:hypothetical protein
VLPALIGLCLIGGGGVLAWNAVEVHDRPDPKLALGLLNSVGVLDPNSGLYSRVWVGTQGCRNPVDVAVVIGGTSEWWELAARRMPSNALSPSASTTPT